MKKAQMKTIPAWLKQVSLFSQVTGRPEYSPDAVLKQFITGAFDHRKALSVMSSTWWILMDDEHVVYESTRETCIAYAESSVGISRGVRVKALTVVNRVVSGEILLPKPLPNFMSTYSL